MGICTVNHEDRSMTHIVWGCRGVEKSMPIRIFIGFTLHFFGANGIAFCL